MQVDVNQGSVMLPLLFANPVYVITENAREDLINKILYADDLVLMRKSLQNLGE